MDERFLISSNQVSKLLPEARRRAVYDQEMCMDNFWLLNPYSVKRRKIGLGDKLGSCLLTLRRSRDLRWGIRKKVIYVPRHRDSSLHLPSAEEVRKKEGSKKRLREENESGNEQIMTEREVEKEFKK